MFENENNTAYQNPAEARAAVDEGLKAHFRQVYNVMSLGLAVTGMVSWGFAYLLQHNEQLMAAVYGNAIVPLILAFAPLAMALMLFRPSAVMRKSAMQLKGTFFIFASIMGLSMSSIFMVYTNTDIARAFFIAAGMFAGTSLYGYTTKKDLSGMGGFLMMGVIGLLIASIVNIFLQSEMLMFIYSFIGVGIFVAMTAYDTQNIKETYNRAHGHEANDKLAVMGAFGLYWNFILIFQYLLQLLGNRD